PLPARTERDQASGKNARIIADSEVRASSEGPLKLATIVSDLAPRLSAMEGRCRGVSSRSGRSTRCGEERLRVINRLERPSLGALSRSSCPAWADGSSHVGTGNRLSPISEQSGVILETIEEKVITIGSCNNASSAERTQLSVGCPMG